MQPNRSGCEVSCKISELGTRLCFSFLKGEMGPPSRPQGFLAVVESGACAKWPGTQTLLEMSSERRGQVRSFAAPQAPKHSAPLMEMLAHTWMLSEWRRHTGGGCLWLTSLPLNAGPGLPG